MRTFEHFPEETLCKVCGTNTDKACVLLPVEGTGQGSIFEAVLVHVDCMAADTFQYNAKANIIYKVLYV